MSGGSREYDHESTSRLRERVRRRTEYSHDHGRVTRFVVQLEYQLDGDWIEVVCSDHDPEREQGHDVTIESVHIDAYRDGENRSP